MMEETDPIDQLIAGQPDAHLWKRWEGGDQAPEDWDEGPVLLRDGEHGQGFRWHHQEDYRNRDIVAYRRDAVEGQPTRETVTIEKRTEGEWRHWAKMSLLFANPAGDTEEERIFLLAQKLGLVLPAPRPITTRMLAAGFTEEEIAAVGKENERG